MNHFQKIETGIQDLFLIEYFSYQDQRGSFSELYREGIFQKFGIEKSFVQKNQSCSKRGVLRGLHIQTENFQGKLLQVLKGKIYDVVVDLRRESPSYGKYYSILLSSEKKLLLWIPEGFAHGFLSLEEETIVQYFCTDYYTPENERGILWSDPTLKIDWKLNEFSLLKEELLLSEKDRKYPSFLEFEKQQNEKKILILGAEGQLGKEFQEFFRKEEIPFLATDRDTLDITQRICCKEFMKIHDISHVIDCAAYNEVDQAEQEQDVCYRINTRALELWKNLCEEKKIPFLTFSTDFVFDGKQEIPYLEVEKAKPLSTYGKTKLEGEKKALQYSKSLVIRTSWLFGKYGNNFCRKLLFEAKKKKELMIVDDQISAPTYTKHLVEFSWELFHKANYGLYHISNDGETSKYDQAKFILEKISWSGKLLRAKTENFGNAAQRPKYSKLDSRKTEFILQKKIPHWKIAIQEYLREIGELK